jgi:hypothetical protein
VSSFPFHTFAAFEEDLSTPLHTHALSTG